LTSKITGSRACCDTPFPEAYHDTPSPEAYHDKPFPEAYQRKAVLRFVESTSAYMFIKIIIRQYFILFSISVFVMCLTGYLGICMSIKIVQTLFVITDKNLDALKQFKGIGIIMVYEIQKKYIQTITNHSNKSRNTT
jgi:hypothetical protein